LDYGINTLVCISTSQTQRDHWLNNITEFIDKLRREKKDNISLYNQDSHIVELDEDGNEILVDDEKSIYRDKPWKNFNFSKAAKKVKIYFFYNLFFKKY
jgi:hypothetical protein